MAIAFPLAGRMADSLAPRYLIIPGIILFAISSILFSNVDANTPFATMALWAMCGRVGLALIFPCLQVATLRPLPPEQLAKGTAMSNFTRQLGGAVGVNVLVIYLQERTSVHVDALTNTQAPGNVGTDMLINQITPLLESAGVVSHYAYAGSTQVLSAVIYLQGNMLAFRDCFLLIGVIFLCCVWLALLMDNRPPARQ
jgi:MFS family permease